MRSKVSLSMVAAAALLLTSLPGPALALGVSVGGVSASVGGSSSVASVSASSNGTSTTASVGTGTGDLASVSSTGTTNDATVNLSDLLGNLGDVTTPVDTPTTPVVTQIADSFDELSSGEQRQLRLRCRDVLAARVTYSQNLVALCQLIVAMK